MPIDKVKFPNGETEDIRDSRIPGIDSAPTANSGNLVTSGGVKSALDGYLPLTGGTLTGNTTLTYGTNLDFVDSNGENHSLRAFASWPDSLAHYAPGNGWTRIWDSGNDGAGSGLDADLLDGKHAGDFVGVYVDGETSVGDFVTPGMYRINMNPGRPSNYANILVVRGASSDTLAQMSFDYYNNGYTYIRSGTLNDIASKSWERFALTSDNVASATKLQTARKIWGQDFDGTGNVDGLLTANLQAGAAGTAIQINDSISQGYSAIRFAVNNAYEATIQYLKNVNENPLGQHVLSIDPVSSNTMPSSAFVSLGLWTNPALWVDCTNYRVGVGTTSPAYKLDVAGDIRGTSATTTLQTSEPSGGMLPNREYQLGTLSGNTTFTLAAGTSGVTNHYFWSFETGSTAPTITWPSAITSWYGGSAPTINASKHYEVSVLDGVAICMEV